MTDNDGSTEEEHNVQDDTPIEAVGCDSSGEFGGTTPGDTTPGDTTPMDAATVDHTAPFTTMIPHAADEPGESIPVDGAATEAAGGSTADGGTADSSTLNSMYAAPTGEPVGSPIMPVPVPGNPWSNPYGGPVGPYGAVPGYAWPPPEAPATSRRAAQRVGAGIALLAIVVASAGIGAALTYAVGNRTVNSSPTILPSGGGPTTKASQSAASKVSPAIVDIYTTLGSDGRGAGTGMILTSDGKILTNNHVIAGASSITVTVAGHGTYDASVIGYDTADDIAELHINATNLPVVHTDANRKLNTGDQVIALGNAGGKGGTPAVSPGSISALNEHVTASDSNGSSTESLTGVIAVHASVEPGDSGGPLITPDGTVIGVDTAAAVSQVQTPLNVGFAIPIGHALSVVSAIDSKSPNAKIHIGERGLLGVVTMVVAPGGAVVPANNGAVVSGLASGGPAEKAGIQVGDTVVQIDNATITDANSLTTALNPHQPGDKVTVSWIDSSGTHHQSTVALIAGPPL